MIPIVYLTGMGVDYTAAVERQVALNADADSAALSAVTPTSLQQSTAAAIITAQNTFNAQAGAMSGISYNPANVNVNIAYNGTVRTVVVSYTANSINFFPSVLGQATIALSGSSTATASTAPNIDFYLLLDASPSMGIAATTAGINTMVANTASQGGCAFACHETHPSSDNLGNPGGEDNYALARNLGVTLRSDLLNTASQNLITTAQTDSTNNFAQYRMAVYSFDVNFHTLGTLTSNLPLAQTEAATYGMLSVYANNWLTSANNNSDADTNYDLAMTSINAAMPNPGNGTNANGDTPQEVLFFVTDGVEDETVAGNRQQSLMGNARCTTIKNRGIRIAVLYTAYLPLPTNAWYNQYIAPFQPNIATQMQNCASPGLYAQVTTDGDITAALAALFELAIKTAYLLR
jgi:hypothetical protein